MTHQPTTTDFGKSRDAFIGAAGTNTGLTRGLWLLAAAMIVFMLAMATVILDAQAREQQLKDEQAQMQAARETISLTAARLGEVDETPEDIGDRRSQLIIHAESAELSQGRIDDLAGALADISDQPCEPIDKAALTRFRASAEAALAEISTREAAHAAAAAAFNQSLRRRAFAVFLLTIAGLGAAIALIHRAQRDQRRLLTAAQDEAGRLAALIAASAEGVTTLDADGRVLAANKRACDLFAAEPEALVGTPLGDLVELEPDENDPDASFAANARAISERGEQGLESQATRLDGSRFPAALTIAAYEYGGAVQYVATLRDITRRREEELAKEAFVSTVTHELRTPLTSISGSLDLLAARVGSEGLPAKSRRLIEIAQTNAHRLIRLINDILDIEKLEAGRADLEIRDLSLRALAEEAMEANAAYATPQGVQFRLTMLEPDVIVRADHDRVFQVANNLLSNAVKASPAGARVEVSVSRLGETGEFSVRDYGAGVPHDFEPQLFKKFAQAETGAGSTGLGLALVREIAERHGGRAYHQHPRTGGAIFTLALPLADTGLPTDTCDTGAPEIVHFDPDPDTVRLVAAAFGPRARIQGYTSLGEARDAVRRRTPDAMIVDLASVDEARLEALVEAADGVPLIGFSSEELDAAAPACVVARLIKSRHGLDVLTATTLHAACARPQGDAP